MKYKLLLIFLLMQILLSSLSFAGIRKVGNGGNSIICRDPHETNKITSAQLLDFYEGATLHAWHPTYTGNTLENILQEALSRLQRVSPRFANRLSIRLSHFNEEALFLDNVILTPTNDSFHVAIPKGCSVEQTIIQKDQLLPGEKKYTISRDIWDRLPLIDQAGLMLHEVIYTEAIESAHTDSVATRYLNSYLSTDLFNQISPADFFELMKKLKFVHAELNDLDLRLYIIKEPIFTNEELQLVPCFPTFFENGHMKSAFAWRDSTLTVNGVNFKLTMAPQDNFPGYQEDLFFYENGSIKKLYSLSSFENLSLFDEKFDSNGEIEFYPSGKLKSIQHVKNEKWVHAGNQKVWIENSIELYESGRLKSASYPSEDLKWSHGSLGILTLSAPFTRSVYEVYENGFLASGEVINGRLLDSDFDLNLKMNMNDPRRITYFHPNGQLHKGCVQSGWIRQNGKTLKLTDGSCLELNESGQILAHKKIKP